MEPVVYTVKQLDGDYALLLDEQGNENLVAWALLPIEMAVGSWLICEMFRYRIL